MLCTIIIQWHPLNVFFSTLVQTFLTHIVQRYNASWQGLAEHTIFFSAEEPLSDGLLRLERVFVPQTGFLGLSTAEFCRCPGFQRASPLVGCDRQLNCAVSNACL